jgi:hypothetical protein
MTIVSVIRDATSEATAYTIADYPYGFRLRCQKRYWVETTKQGQRVCEQTSNPKCAGLVWNKPKKSTYSDIKQLYLNEDDHVKSWGFSIQWQDLAALDAYIKQFNLDVKEPRLAAIYRKMQIVEEARKCIKVEICEASSDPYEADRRKEESERALNMAMSYAVAKVDGQLS